jgi:hypothetical protein
MRLAIPAIILVLLNACSRGPAPPSTVGQIEGPPASSLSHEQLTEAYADCVRFGRMDDPRVRYTARYCSAVMSAHLAESYSSPGKSNADPSINRVH